MKDIIEIQLKRLVAGCDHYAKSAPTVREWMNDLYVRLHEDPDAVILSELILLWRLYRGGNDWSPPNYAANLVFHLLTRLGRDTTGQAGF